MGKFLNEWEIVKDVLKNASEHGMEVEVVMYALKYMKENPLLTIEEAIMLGYNEWIK